MKNEVVKKRFKLCFIKVCILFIGFSLALGLSFCVIAYAVVCVEQQKIISNINDLLSWYHPIEHNPDGYVPTIAVASASLLLSMITIFQSHYSRNQDRVLSFPRNCLNAVSIGLNAKTNIQAVRRYFEPIEAETAIEFCYQDAFASYYKPCPYRLFVCLQKDVYDAKTEWEEINISNSQYSNLLDNNPENNEMIISGSYSRLLNEYCNKADKNMEYSLVIILDIVWINSLLTLGNRMFSNLYIRQYIHIDKSIMTENAGIFPYNYRAINTEFAPASFLALCLGYRCKRTNFERRVRICKQRRNQRLQEK